jgi:hypothetical protein
MARSKKGDDDMEDEFKHLSRGDLIQLILAMEAEESYARPGWWVGVVLFAAIVTPWLLIGLWVLS